MKESTAIALIVSFDIWMAAFWWVALDIRSYLKEMCEMLREKKKEG